MANLGTGRKRKRTCLAIPEESPEKGLKFIAAQCKSIPYDQRGEIRREKNMLMHTLCFGRAIKRTLMGFFSIFRFRRGKNNPSHDYDQITFNLPMVSVGDNVRIPGDLVVEILCKLPVKSLICFKTVCKSWNFVINSHDFIQKHLHRNNPIFGGYSVEFQGNILPFEVSYVVGACNGIICLYTTAYEKCRDEKKLVLFNPSTREFSFVPPELLPGWGFYGFCYLPTTQEYQIILFRGMHGCKRLDITTLTLGKITSSREAKNIRVPGRILNPIQAENKKVPRRILDPRQATNGTTIFWLGIGHVNENEIVICYDVIEGRFSKMEVPPYPSIYLVYRSLGVLGGSTIMFVTQLGTACFDIWMLIEDVSNGKHWTKYRTVGPSKRVLYPLDVCWYDRWILCSSYGSICIIKNTRVECWSEDLFYYDLLTDQVESYCDIHNVDKYKCWRPPTGFFINYVESLVSIKSLVPYMITD